MNDRATLSLNLTYLNLPPTVQTSLTFKKKVATHSNISVFVRVC